MTVCAYRNAGCKLPRFLLRRYAHRPWICDCGAAWRTQRVGGMDGWVWIWERWETPS